VRQSGQVVNVIPDDSAASQTYDDAKSAHVHERVNEQIDHEANVAVSISRD
jgi:hypothetical protein